MVGGLFRRDKPMSEVEEETEKLEAENQKTGVELSIAQKREMIARLKERGLTPKHFGSPPDWKRIWNWVRTH